MPPDKLYSRVLVLGSQGNLGSQIVQELQKNSNRDVIAWTRTDCDLTDLCALEMAILQVHPSILINAAAYNDVDACEIKLDEQRSAIKLNIQLVECLARICQEINAKLIHFSTNYVFSGNSPSYTEFDRAFPINFYGMTKQLGEEAITARFAQGLNGCIIRVSNLFGPKGISASSKPNFFELMDKVSETREYLQLVDDEKNCFTYTKDVASEVVKRLEDEAFQGIFHLVNSDPVTWYEAIKIYFDLVGKSKNICPVRGEYFERAAQRPKSAVLQSTRIPIMRSFSLAIADYIQELDHNHM